MGRGTGTAQADILYGRLEGRSSSQLATKKARLQEHKEAIEAARIKARFSKQRCRPFSFRDFKTLERLKDKEWPRVAQRYGIPQEIIEEAFKDAKRFPFTVEAAYGAILKYLYPPGTRVRLEKEYPDSVDWGDPPQSGELGTITGLDDLPKFEVDWDGGSTLSLLPKKDKFTFLIPGTE